MKKEWVLTKEAFDALLGWLDADRDRAGLKYEVIRLRLIKIFTCRGCAQAEELADEIINRVSTKVIRLAPEYDGDPALYFYAFCDNLHREYLRKYKMQQAGTPLEAAVDHATMFAPSLDHDVEPEYECLEHCLDQLPKDNRKLVLEYYQHEKHAKIEHRKVLAMELGIAVNALRIRAHRIRLGLQQCVRNCLDQQPVN